MPTSNHSLRLHGRAATAAGSYIVDIVSATVPALIVKLRSILVIPIVVRVLGLASYGAWLQIAIVTHLCSLLGGLGLHTSLIRYYPECKTTYDKKVLVCSVFLTSTLFSLCICGCLWILSPALTTLVLGDTSLTGIFRLSILVVPLHMLNLLLLTLFRARNEIGRYASFQTIFTLVDLIITIVAVLVFRSITGLILAGIFSLLIANTTIISIYLAKYKLFPLPKISMPLIRKYLKYSLPVLPSQFADEIAVRGDRLVIGAFLGPAAVGTYSVIYALASLSVFVHTPVVDVLFPKLAHLRATNQRSVAAQYMRRTLASLGLFGLCVLSLLVVLRDWLWLILAGPNVAVITSDSLALLLIIAGIGVILYALSRILSLNLFTGDQTHFVPLLFGLAAIVNIAANLVLIPILGLLGAVIATLLAYLVMALATLWFIRKKDLI